MVLDPSPPAPPPELDRPTINDFLLRLEAPHSRASTGIQLPNTIDGLRQIGLDEALAAGLRALVDAGNEENLVVRAFLEALLSQAHALGVSRQLQRLLRHQFATTTEHEALRCEVSAWVGRASAPATL